MTQSAIIAVAMVPLLFISTLAVGRWLKRRQGVSLGFFYLLFCAVLSIYVPLAFFGPQILPQKTPAPTALTQAGQLKEIEKQIAGLEATLKATREQLGKETPVALAGHGSVPRSALMRHLTAVLTLLSTFVIIALLRRYFWELWFERKQKSPAPKFLSQLLSLLLFIGTVLTIVAVDYGKDLTAFVFGSTVVVGIVGFAMQDLLGNIIAGIALEIGKPFKIGDWLIVDTHRAEVIEVNWRSTRLRTNDDIHLDLPNKTVAGSIITNLSYPTQQHGVRLRLNFGYNIPPNRIKECVVRAALRANGVLGTPLPKVYLREFGESFAIYEIRFWILEEAHYNEICDSVRTNVWYEAQRANIPIPFPVRTLHIEKARGSNEHDKLEAARASMRKQPFLKLLDENQASKLLSNARMLRFGRGERVIEQGDQGLSMFIVSSGEAEVLVKAQSHDTRVATLKTGDYFGEMSLLTGEPRSATVVARSDCEMWEIQKAVLAEILQQNEGLVAKLGELLAKRRMELEGVLAASTARPEISAKQREYTEGILERLYSFFEL
ncbi:MAG: MscS Mechanosensitive ion channel [Chthoniobacteraceae bacterium]|nr:MscS Mechanosensitive ion channel [Chthoniobacteraceae bacterium]